MLYIYVLVSFIVLPNIRSVSSIVYSCDRNAECGCSKTDANLNKIVGGESAVNSSWGWSVSIQLSSAHFCGGAIISPLHIITAAHCFSDSTIATRNVRVVAGINILSETTSSIAQVRSIIRVFLHPYYDKNSKRNDIAVLRLNQPFHISNENNTARLCIPRINSTDANENYPVANSELVAIGWGKIESGQNLIPSNQHLLQVTLYAVSADRPTCRRTINDRQLQFCAATSGGGKDTCQGDSGGPLMRFESSERRWVLAGITSYGVGCGLPDYAGVYTRASVYYNWLHSIVTDRFIGTLVNDSSSILIDPFRNRQLCYWSLVLLLCLFFQK